MEAKILRIYMSNTDKYQNQPMYELVVRMARQAGIGGATVLKGVMGFGSSSVISSVKFWEITEKLPVVVEIVDEAAKIDRFFETIRPYFEQMPKGCLATVEKAEIVFHQTGKKLKEH